MAVLGIVDFRETLSDNAGSVPVGMARLCASAEDKAQLCRHPHNHALTATRSSDQVVIMVTAILLGHKSRTYSYRYKCVEGVTGTLEEMVGTGMYVWDTRAMIPVEVCTAKKVCSAKSSGGGGGGGGGSGDEVMAEIVAVSVVTKMKFRS